MSFRRRLRPRTTESPSKAATANEEYSPVGSSLWPCIRSLNSRQLGLTSSVNFARDASGSLGLVRRLKRQNELAFHEGCVNTLHFNDSGDLLASASDDLAVAVWDWARCKKNFSYESGHTNNVFQAKFMPHTNSNTIVSCARDGQVRVGFLSSGGVSKSTKRLAVHKGAAHKLCIEPGSPSVFLTCGEDGFVFEVDLREDKAHKLFCCRADEHKKVSLYTIFIDPWNVHKFAVGGRDQFARIFDRRKLPEDNKEYVPPVKKYCPHHLIEDNDLNANITCLVYSYNGSELLVSYNDEDIYMFDSLSSSGAQFVKRYTGHRNLETVKGVNFFGPRSEYIVSGSDCGHVFLWDKQTEDVVQFLEGDRTGVVNCLEPHPHTPVLATSGLDHDVKIWAPTEEEPTPLNGLEDVIKENTDNREDNRNRPHDPISEHMLQLMMQHLRRTERRTANRGSDSDTSSDDDDDEGGQVQCSPS